MIVELQRIDVVVLPPRHEMDMRSGRVARRTLKTDGLALVNELADLDIDSLHVAVRGRHAPAMIDLDRVATTIVIPRSEDHLPILSGHQWRADLAGADVYPV